ncbi:bifunctional diguanylate cyclase/phosphodiesterase [Cupriavidus basilensis]|uniref:bifunctional diguanylate cyclase/phosphodiesterase n=1 Tax=Cupriavidus basilensis TaxID=68895 RepID=UPI0023E7796A|nr:EAL domain-containing protein [Cupriavidus basilensis]MDF3885500.1 EAL domain-containing protein [Cupriavidus basilensis]
MGGVSGEVGVRHKLTQFLRPLCRLGSVTVTLSTLLLGILSTTVVYAVCTELLERDAELRFTSDTDDVIQQIDTRIRLYTDVLVTMQALFGASDHVSRAEFRDFVNGLSLPQRYPGFQTLNYAPYVPAAELAAFVASQRKDPVLHKAGVDFAIRPAGRRPAYFVLTYAEPLDENRTSIGIDMGAEPHRLGALEKARDTGQAVSSGRLIFSEAKRPHIGIALRLPVYRNGLPLEDVEARRRAYVGSVGAGIRVGDLLSNLANPEMLRRTRFRLYDAGASDMEAISPSAATLLYDSLNGLTENVGGQTKPLAIADPIDKISASEWKGPVERANVAASRPYLSKTVYQSFGGRRWLIEFSAAAMAISGPQRFLPALVLGSGLIISLLLSGLAYALSSSRTRALAVADGMTRSLRESQAALAEAQRIARLGNWRIDLERNWADFSGEMVRLIGGQGARPTLDMLLHALDADYRATLVARMQTALADRGAFELECPYRSSRGRKGWLHLIGNAHGLAGSRILRGTAQDITQRKAAEQARAQEHRIALHLSTATCAAKVPEQIVRTLVEGMEWEAGAFWPTEAGRAMQLAPVCVTPSRELGCWLARRMTWPQATAALMPDGPHWYASRSAIARMPQHAWLGEQGILTVFIFLLRRGTVTLGEVELYSRDRRARDRYALAMGSAIASQTSHFLLRKEAEENLRFIANHDALTGLPNRLMFRDHLERRLAIPQSRQDGLSVLFVDLDQFKIVNDTMGHDAGDILLRGVADRLRAALPDVELIARLGGDEFVVLVEPKGDPTVLSRTIRNMQAALAPGFAVNDKELRITASIGISSFPEDAADAQTLLKHADLAMFSAKQRGKNAHQFYAREMSESLRRRVDMEAHLRRALERNEFELYYQPRISLTTNACTAVEALIRWHHPEFGLVLPGDFIPFAEESGAIVQIGAWVLREACRQNAQWLAQGLASMRVAVNLSARQFADKSLRLIILDALRQAGLPGNLLELELTESLVMRDAEQAARWLSKLKRTGVRLAIDDFGTGYSSLAYLSRFPIDVVKIDRTFIRHVPESRSDTQIASAVIGLGHRLDLDVVAEGVENAQQLNFLRSEGCDEVQGYYFSQPLPAEDITAFLVSHTEHGLAQHPGPQSIRALLPHPGAYLSRQPSEQRYESTGTNRQAYVASD